jgi:hypothetical protein
LELGYGGDDQGRCFAALLDGGGSGFDHDREGWTTSGKGNHLFRADRHARKIGARHF